MNGPLIVVWRITERCNLSCPFCAYDRRVNRSRREANLEDVRRFGALLAEYRQQTGRPVLISWIGGEPFLVPHLAALSIFFTELDLQVSATTNGTALVSELVREHVLAHYTELTISVDGVGEVHDRLRGWPGGYAAIRDTFIWLAEAKRKQNKGPLLRANVVLMRQTVADFERLCVELAGWGVEEITFNQLGGRDRPEFFPEHRLLPDQAASMQDEIPAIRSRLRERGVRLAGSENYLSRIRASTWDEAVRVTDCGPGRQFLFVTEDGVVAPCSFTPDGYGVPLAELNDVDSLRKLPLSFTRARAERRLPACEDCVSTRVFEKFST